ncbi:electron transport complex subunit RsxC [Thalassotalea castellviae]|uniref:Ion-translocating oxidoreductase complex subunit C n=1 Tax=Thalassotalea castellviae TaxID=3075612 RepID=A0ABU3A6N7_9GAMM|nr:electron transport complex subunit RsxC [Thalassotalea sp. W431]MDT0604753.1 electron transport complex subunit RsxC [Thalassotalea sp. W431]
MESVIERIEKGQFWKFHGGIHPPEMKFLTSNKPILQLPIPEKLVIPIQQHIGEAGELLVNVGDIVLKGQALTRSTLPLSVPVHAPTSGKIAAIENATIAHPSGLEELCITLIPDGEDKWRERTICPEYQQLSKPDIIEKISNAGISGMGGAGFPTHIKVSTKSQINYLIINASECEPYITADDLLVREHSSAILDGINILDHLLEPAFILIGIEDNKPEAIQALQNATKDIDKIKVCVLPTQYPVGGEKQLIMALTGTEVPSGVLPTTLGIVMQNIATCFAIADAVIHDTPLIKRVVTVSGQALAKPQNVWALLGTPVEFLLDECGYPQQAKKHIIMGGPMMGFSLPNNQVPIVKTTNCILAPSEEEIPNDNQEVECIRCGQCAEVCPSQLLPQELQWSAKAKDHQQLNTLNLFDCIECGACAYVCPSHIPLVHYYRVAKAEIRQQHLLDLKAEKAKVRFEARKLRLEREKLAREEKHKKAAAARKARMNSGTPEANNEKSAVAAALARVKAKKAQANAQPANENVENSTDSSEKKSQVAAAIARAKAKKQAAKNNLSVSETLPDEIKADTVVGNSEDKSDIDPVEAKKAKIAAAVAKAKAKKLAVDQTTVTTSKSDNTVDVSPAEAKKAKIAAAVAKAKAKKQQAELKSESLAPANNTLKNAKQDESVNDAATDKKARIAAAVAKAKAKKQQAESK